MTAAYNHSEILTLSQHTLNQRLVLIAESTVPELAREAGMIRRELARRVGCAS